jgi:hypothetical protein
MGRPKKTDSEVATLETINFDTDMEDIDDQGGTDMPVAEEEKTPLMSDPKWEEFVLSKFEPLELEQGRPKVHGLRRVVRLLLGPIRTSSAKIVQCPTIENGQRATVEYTVKVWQVKSLDAYDGPHILKYTDVSDAWMENVNGIEFARHPSATASTRSEGRALRKLLNLSTPAAEEIAIIPADENAMEGNVSENQITRIDLKCEELKINVMKFINMGKNKYEDIRDVPYIKATVMCKRLGEYHRKEKEIPSNIRGYDPSWRKEEN